MDKGMLIELNKQIIETKATLLEKQKLLSILEDTKESLNHEQDKELHLRKLLEKEELDVSRLQTSSIIGLFYTFLGSKERQLDKERQELLSAKLKYDSCCQCIELLKKETAEIEENLKKYRYTEGEFKNLLEKKKKFILGSKNSFTKELEARIEKVSDLKAKIKELREAINAANKVKAPLRKALDLLDSAEDWGTWDMLGGGLIASTIKHGKIDDASNIISKIQIPLRKLRKEFSDINVETRLEIKVSEFEFFSDCFFDNLISDWTIQSKILDSSIITRDLYDNIEKLSNELNEKVNKFLYDIELENKNIVRFIENYE